MTVIFRNSEQHSLQHLDHLGGEGVGEAVDPQVPGQHVVQGLGAARTEHLQWSLENRDTRTTEQGPKDYTTGFRGAL